MNRSKIALVILAIAEMLAVYILFNAYDVPRMETVDRFAVSFMLCSFVTLLLYGSVKVAICQMTCSVIAWILFVLIGRQNFADQIFYAFIYTGIQFFFTALFLQDQVPRGLNWVLKTK